MKSFLCLTYLIVLLVDTQGGADDVEHSLLLAVALGVVGEDLLELGVSGY